MSKKKSVVCHTRHRESCQDCFVLWAVVVSFLIPRTHGMILKISDHVNEL